MSEQSYKILVAKRLAIDPNELLSYFEFHDHAICTTPDGRQHKFSFADLTRPAKKPANDIAENAKKGPDLGSAAAGSPSPKSKKVAKREPKL
jgi:hypothetical protein